MTAITGTVLPGRNARPVGDLPDLKECALSFERCGRADIGRRPRRIYCSLKAWRIVAVESRCECVRVTLTLALTHDE